MSDKYSNPIVRKINNFANQISRTSRLGGMHFQYAKNEILKAVAENISCVNLIDEQTGKTPLTCIAEIGWAKSYAELIQGMAELGADPSIPDRTGDTPLDYAILDLDIERIKIILDLMLPARRQKTLNDAFLKALQSFPHNDFILGHLIDAGANVNITVKSVETPMTLMEFFVYRNRLNLLVKILDNGLDLQRKYNHLDGEEVLSQAIWQYYKGGNFEPALEWKQIIQKLIQKGVDPDAAYNSCNGNSFAKMILGKNILTSHELLEAKLNRQEFLSDRKKLRHDLVRTLEVVVAKKSAMVP